MEYLDLYDVNGNLTGESIPRTKDKGNVPEGKYIKLVLIFIQNSDNKFLFQTTSECKGHVIATTGGHVQSGQTSKEAVINEVSEELGKIFKLAITDIYYLKKDIDLNNIVLQEEEVESVNWLSIDEINKLISEDKLRKGNIEPFKEVLEYIKCA